MRSISTCAPLMSLQMLDLIIMMGILLFFCGAIIYMSRVRRAAPNEWMLVFRDGKLIKAGVGLRYVPCELLFALDFPHLDCQNLCDGSCWHVAWW